MERLALVLQGINQRTVPWLMLFALPILIFCLITTYLSLVLSKLKNVAFKGYSRVVQCYYNFSTLIKTVQVFCIIFITPFVFYD